MEVWGDAKLWHALLAEYRQKQVLVTKEQNVKLDNKLSNPSDLVNDCTFVGRDKDFFIFTPLGDLFKSCIMDTFGSMQSYVDPIVTKDQLKP